MADKVVEDKLREFLYEDSLKDEFENLTNDDSLLEMGLIDSVKMLDLIEFIETQFNITVEEDDMVPENFDSINAMVTYIRSRQQ